MGATSTDELFFNPIDPAFVQNPYEMYERLRETDPVHKSPLLHGWIVTRYDDVNRLLRDPSVSSDIHNATPNILTINELERLAENPRASETVVLMDDPDHARVRRLLSEPFRQREIEKLRGDIARRVDAAIDAIAERHGAGGATFDLIEEFAYPLPVEIFSSMLGIPDEEHEQFRYWTQCVARTIDPIMSAAERDESMAGLDAMYAYLETQVDAKRANPADDMLTRFVFAQSEGEVLTRLELLAQVVTLYMAGHEPTASLLGTGMVGLMRHPDQLRKVQQDPDLIRNAVLELLRYDGPNQFVRRVLTQPTTIGEVELPGGEVIYASPAAANHDPRRWGDTADSVVVDRPDAAQHLQFGAGVHSCLGSHLARMQAEIAFAALFRRMPDIELAGDPVVSNRMFIRGLASLPVRATITS